MATEKYGSLDDFIDQLVSSPPQNPHSFQLEIDHEDYEGSFQVLVEIFTKSMKYLFSDAFGKVNLDELTEAEYQKISDYFNSFGYRVFLEKIVDTETTEYGATEKKPINEHELKAQCLKIKTDEALFVIYFDILLPN